MIRRTVGNDWLLTTQPAHAIFAGEVASRYGNADFDPPTRREPVLTAITLHDAGWSLHDDSPSLNKNGEPLHVFEMPLGEALKIWSASVDRATEQGGHYCGLLVSLHQLALSAMPHPGMGPDPRRHFELNKFQQKQIERQETFRRQIGLRTDMRLSRGLAPFGTSKEEDELHRDFRLLTLMDRLSLQLCCGKMLFREIGDIVPRAGADPVTLTTGFVGENDLVIDPWH